MPHSARVATSARESRSSSVLAAMLLVIFLFLVARPPDAAANGCAGGGEPRPDEGGIGGTGILSMQPDDEGGIGGTGISAEADTGVIGTVTGFGSICVNGVEIHYGADTPVQIDGQPATAGQLAVGQVVEVTASGTASDLQARHIAVRHVVSGPVTRLDAERAEIEVMGQTVLLSPLTRVGDGESAAVATAFPLESSVQVSGMRRDDGAVEASRINRVDTPAVQVVGPVTKVDSGMVWVAGTAARTNSAAAIAVGDEVQVAGHWDGAAIRAASITAIPRVPFDGHVTHVNIEGFARPIAAGQLQVGSFAVELLPAAVQEVQQASTLETRIRIQAVIENRHVLVERIRVMDELPPLPPLWPRDAGGWGGGRPGDARNTVGVSPPDPSRPGDARGPSAHDGWAAKPDSGAAAPPVPIWGDQPSVPQPPDHSAIPQVPDRPPPPPQPPDRPAMPQVPDRPPLPQRPDRPPIVDRPSIPVRPDLPARR